jgi:transposase
MYSRSAPRRRHGAEFKTKVLAACDEPDASISGVALAHGLNANLVRQWRAGRGVKLAGVTVTPPARSKAPKSPASTTSPLLGANPEFVAIEMSAPAKTVGRVAADPADAAPTAEPLIQIELRRGPLHLNVRWPTSAADDCTTWLRELSSGMFK